MFPPPTYNNQNSYYQYNNNQYNQYQFNLYNQNPYAPQTPASEPTMEFPRDENDFDIKFFRLHPSLLNIINTPLNGIYQNLDSIQEEPKLENEFKNFDIAPLFSIDNLLILNPSFGRIFVNETLDGLITFHNKSDHQKQIKDLEVIFKVEDNKTNNASKKNPRLNIKLPKDTFIPKKSVYSIKFSNVVDSVGKYVIDINVKSRSDYYDEQYKTHPQKNNIKRKGKDYLIENDKIEFSHNKRLTFDANLPFLIEKKFYNYQMDFCFIETKIINNTIYPLTITELALIPKSKQEIQFKPIDDLKQIYINEYRNKFINESNNNNKYENIFMTKYLTLQQDEVTNAIFKFEYCNEYLEENSFVLKIKWLNLFDSKEKEQFYEIKNDFNIFNPYFTIKTVEKPENKIIENQNFKIMLNLESKNLKKKIIVSLEKETKADQDKINEREFEIIDIIEKRIELSQKIPKNNFILICKSDYLGNVGMPKIKFCINEENKIKDEISCDSLIHFNCVSKDE